MPILPVNSSRATPAEPLYPVGALVMYENDSAPVLAVVTAAKQKIRVLNSHGASIDLPPARLHRLPGEMPSAISGLAAQAEHLRTLTEQSHERAEQIDLRELWELLAEEEREYSTTDLCATYSSNAELVDYIGLRIALLRDKTFFKRKNAAFIPRAPAVVAELEHAAAVRREKIERQQQTVDFLRRRIQEPSLPLPSSVQDALSLLEDLACEVPQEAGRRKEAIQFLELCLNGLEPSLGRTFSGNEAHKAYQLLLAVHHFTPRTNPNLIRYRVPDQFSDDALAEARAIVARFNTEEFGDRIDLRHLETFTVDDSSTRDMDDALSLERVDGGLELGVHISDVAAAIPVASVLDRESRERATSVYVPERTINMLPCELSQGAVSLVQGEPRLCVSFMFRISPTHEVIDGRIMRSVIRSSRRMTYEELDDLLEAAIDPYVIIYSIASAHEAQRTMRGATRVMKHDIVPRVDAAGRVTLEELDEQSPARSTVAETAVMANALAARFAAEHQIPFIFRSQEASAPAPDLQASPPEGPASEYASRANLKRSLTSTTALPHASLGLPAYAQVTSPIRRYVDLINQRQLVHFLQFARPQYDADEVERIIAETEETLGHAGTLSKASRRFWLLRYLEQQVGVGGVMFGTVLRTDLKTPLVELETVYMNVLVRLPKDAKPGDRYKLRISQLDAAFDYLRLEPIERVSVG